ncbi:MAG: hypothetical protein JW700_04330 [Candidatus Aenigmarchaeota archaeon]|nr:hypothetical protein [Candidatus Aenigmarchaeota archaeon]
MMAVFTIGADDVRINQMMEVAQAWGFIGKYSDSKRLLNDVIKKKIAYVLVVDPEAIEDDVKNQLYTMNVKVINFNDKKRLEGLLRV